MILVCDSSTIKGATRLPRVIHVGRVPDNTTCRVTTAYPWFSSIHMPVPTTRTMEKSITILLAHHTNDEMSEGCVHDGSMEHDLGLWMHLYYNNRYSVSY
jgi:hypothetical protein